MTTIKSNDRKARKDHLCDWCLGKITKGEIYESAFLKNDGTAYQWKNHKDCSWIADKLKMFDQCDPGEGVSTSDFMENIWQEFDRLGFKKESTTNLSALTRVIEHHKKQEIYMSEHPLEPIKKILELELELQSERTARIGAEKKLRELQDAVRKHHRDFDNDDEIAKLLNSAMDQSEKRKKQNEPNTTNNTIA